MVGRSRCSQQLGQEIQRVARFDASVLITGPSGTGKELVARQLHAHSPRHAQHFIPVDCALLTGELMATQLFGHVAGAFTGANHAVLGCFRAADGGTLFLDEIGEMPLCLQAKLLRAIQERAIAPVGSHEPTPVDVRIVAATNRDLKAEVQAGRFREDLYFRLNVVTLRTTALAERRNDIDVLATYFLEQLADEGHPRKHLTPGALEALHDFAWPGNVRQLRNVMEQAAIEADGDLIGLPLVMRLLSEASFMDSASPFDNRWCSQRQAEPNAGDSGADPADCSQTWESLAEHERRHLIETLEHTYYNRSVAARLLGISRQSLIRRMGKHAIEVPDLPGKPRRDYGEQ